MSVAYAASRTVWDCQGRLIEEAQCPEINELVSFNQAYVGRIESRETSINVILARIGIGRGLRTDTLDSCRTNTEQ